MSETDGNLPIFTLEEETKLFNDLNGPKSKSTLGIDDTDYLRRSVQLPKN